MGESPLFYWALDSDAMGGTIVDKVVEIAERVGRSEGIDIVDVELAGGGGSRLLRIFIDKPQGVTHSDCESVSHQVGTILDVEDVIPGGRYTLEVSSPGLERKLSQPKDFERFQGKKVKFVLREPVEDRRHWEGTLAGYSDGTITIETAPGRRISFDLQKVQKANLKFEW